MPKSTAEKVLEQKERYEISTGRKPECVVMDKWAEKDIPAEIYTSDLLLFGMHVVIVEDMAHGTIRCGRMR